MNTATADFSDDHPESPVCEPLFRDFGGREAFSGPISTLKVFEDNAAVRAALEQPGEGRVLVVDGGGSLRCALLGGKLGQLVVDNAWAGVVVYGAVRDVAELRLLDVGIRALGSCPRKSHKGLHSAHAEVVVSFAGVRFQPGHWLYADADGIVLNAQPVHL